IAPASAETLDQTDRSRQAARLNVDRGSLGGESDGLGRDDLEIRWDSGGVAILRQYDRSFRRPRPPGLLLCFPAQDAQRCQIVLDVLQRREHLQPVNRDGGVVGRYRLLRHGAPLASIEEKRRELRTHRPKAIWQGEPVRNAGASIAPDSGEQEFG